MEPLEQLREKIDDFPGYDTNLARRRSDEYVRSYLGEALTGMAASRPLCAELQARLDALVLRVAFADPKAFNVHDGIGASDSHDDGGAVAEADVATVDLADKAGSVDSASEASYLEAVTVTLDERDAALRAAALKIP
jgi:hypothetical protein